MFLMYFFVIEFCLILQSPTSLSMTNG